MREILFRGKRIDNGEWVEGSLHLEYEGVTDTLQGTYLLGKYARAYAEAVHGCLQVDPSTVGQYTGLTDKNGKRIFEGDILSIAQKSNGIGNYYYPPIKYPSNAIVKWDKCSWMWEIIAKLRYYLTFPNAWCHFECEVIGNATDNPELLEVGE